MSNKFIDKKKHYSIYDIVKYATWDIEDEIDWLKAGIEQQEATNKKIFWGILISNVVLLVIIHLHVL